MIPCFPALKFLVLTGCRHLDSPKVITKAIAQHCPKLETIAVDLTPIPAKTLQAIPSLKTVFVTSFKVKGQFPFQLVCKNPLDLIPPRKPEQLVQLQELLSFVAQPQLADYNGATLLNYACSEKKPSIEIIRLLLALPNIDPNYVCCTRPVSPRSLYNPWLPHYPWLPSHRAISGIYGLSCLHQVVGHPALKTGALSELITLLVQNGANPYLIGQADMLSPLAIAVYRQAHNIAEDMVNNSPVSCDINGETVIHYACKYYENPETFPSFEFLINAAIKRGYDINKQSHLGYTALLFAALTDDERVVRFLFDKGTKVINTDYFHHFLWKKCHNVGILELLYQNGLDLMYQVNGDSVLTQQAKSNFHEGLQWILSKDQGKTLVKQKSKNLSALHAILNESYLHQEQYNMIQALLEAGADPNELDAEDRTPLMVMILRSSPEKKKEKKSASVEAYRKEVDGELSGPPSIFERVIQLLISHGADINGKNSKGRSVAHVLSERYGSREHILKILLRNGADFTLRDKKDVTPLFLFAWSEFNDIVTLLQAGVKPESKHHPSGLTLLHALAQTRDSTDSEREIVQAAVENGIDINHRDVSGYTALHYAVESRKESFCEILLEFGADVSLQTKLGHNPILLALMPSCWFSQRKEDEFKYQKPRVQSEDDRIFDVSILEKMVQQKPNSVTASDITNRNVLHYLAGHFDCYHPNTELLLRHATKEMINQQDEEGNTPLHYVLLRYSELKTKKELCRNCAEEIADDYESDEGLEYSERQQRKWASTATSLIKELLQRGAKLNIQNNSNMKTPRHLYCEIPSDDEKEEWKDLFLASLTEEDCKIQDNQGDTVLHILARSGELTLCSEKLLQQVDWSILNNCGRSALHEACYVPNKDLLNILKSPTANLTQPESRTGRTPLSILLQQYLTHPKHKTALIIQCLLSHTDIQKDGQLPKFATPELLDQIRNSTKRESKEEKEPAPKAKFVKILQLTRKKYRDGKRNRSLSRSKSPTARPRAFGKAQAKRPASDSSSVSESDSESDY